MTVIGRDDDELARLRELEREVLAHGQAGAFARLWRKSSRERDDARRQLQGAVEPARNHKAAYEAMREENAILRRQLLAHGLIPGVGVTGRCPTCAAMKERMQHAEEIARVAARQAIELDKDNERLRSENDWLHRQLKAGNERTEQ